MAQTGFTPIITYHSTTASAVPVAGNLSPGELALNINDMKLYCENSSGVVTLLASAAGSSGDVVGPASATDTAVALFDGTTGKLLKNSTVTVTTGGSVTGASFVPSGSTVATNGLYLPAANTVALSTNSTERMRIDNAGNISLSSGGTVSNQRVRLAGSFTQGTTSSGNSFGFVQAGTVQSDVTNLFVTYRSEARTAAASFALGNYWHFQASQASIGAGSSISSQMGFLAESTLTGATNNYGFYSDIASGTGRWNFYASGTAANYFGGNTIINGAVGIGAAGSPSYGTSGQVLTSQGSGSPPVWAAASSSTSIGLVRAIAINCILP